MTSLTFYGGVNEIGGNKILVKDRDTSVLLDFGKSFGTWGRYFEEYMKPTSSRGIETFWKTGLLPDLKGIYRPDLLEFAGAPVHKEPSIDAILLSHAHQDHASYISFLDNEIPVYCSETTKTVLEAVEEVGQRDLEQEVTGFKLRPMLRKDYRQPETPRNMKTVKNKVKIGSIEAEFHPVDHSIPGACAMVLHCSDSTIVYSGDIRLHGTFGHLTCLRALDVDQDRVVERIQPKLGGTVQVRFERLGLFDGIRFFRQLSDVVFYDFIEHTLNTSKFQFQLS